MDKKEADRILSEGLFLSKLKEEVDDRIKALRESLKPYGCFHTTRHRQVVEEVVVRSMDYERLIKEHPKIMRQLKNEGIFKVETSINQRFYKRSAKVWENKKAKKITGPEKFSDSKKSP